MNHSSSAKRVARPSVGTARVIGKEARRLLENGFRGEVLAPLSNAVYLLGEDGEVLWVAGEGASPHRRCILSFWKGAHRGQKISFDPPCLLLDGSPWVDADSGEEWKPPILEPESARALPSVEADLRSLLGLLRLMEIPDGLGPSIFMLSALIEGGAQPFHPPGSIMARAKDQAAAIARSCLRRDLRGCAAEGMQLVGLGQGLTPSGDDFLGGLFFASRSLYRAYPEDFPLDEDRMDELVQWAKTRTHPISHVILRDMISGHGPGELHDLFSKLFLEGNHFDAIFSAAMRVTRIGHSSGWDMLAGALTGLLMTTYPFSRGVLYGTT